MTQSEPGSAPRSASFLERLRGAISRRGLRAREERIALLEDRVLELQAAVFGTSEATRRWTNSLPDSNLTWGLQVTGDSFIRKAEENGVFGSSKRILEIGPGYGRLIAAVLERRLPFLSYLGLDISPSNVAYLSTRFKNAPIQFATGDAETFHFEGKFDAMISSLTFKHIYPSFEPVLRNLRPAMQVGGVVVFDLLEASPTRPRHRLENDPEVRPEATYVRRYTPAEVSSILAESGYRLRTITAVTHRPMFTRMLVVAET